MAKMIERAKIIGRCQKCGRSFVTMPRDNLDHYCTGGNKCGGEVQPVATDVSNAVEK